MAPDRTATEFGKGPLYTGMGPKDLKIQNCKTMQGMMTKP
jgi:hypothetical protein